MGTSPISSSRRAAIHALAGAVGGTAGDLCHVLSGTEGYPASMARVPGLPLPWWVPPLFAGAGLAIGMGIPWADRFFAPRARPSGASVGWGLALLLSTWAASGFLPLATGGAKDIVITAAAIVAWGLFDRTRSGILLGLVTAVAGTSAEALQIHLGRFHYMPAATNLVGVPSWLPQLYFCASIAVGNFGRWLAFDPLDERGSGRVASPSSKASAPTPRSPV